MPYARVFLVGLLLVAVCSGPAFSADAEYDSELGVVYARQGDEPLKADVFVPRGEGPFPAVLVVHGGAWMSGGRGQLGGIAKQLAANGYTAVAISYRLAPKHPFPAQIEDCQAAVRWMRAHAQKYKIDPRRIGGFGYSAGGHLVALLGAMDDDAKPAAATDDRPPSARLQAVVAGGAPLDFRILPEESTRLAYWLGGSRKEKPENYTLASPINFVSRDDPPMFFFHGEKDALVPVVSPLAMDALLKVTGVTSQVHQVPGAGHIGAILDAKALAAGLEFFNVHLKAQRPAVAPAPMD